MSLTLCIAFLRCRRHLNIRGKSANLPAITERDWLDIKFGVDVGVDYYALSFVRNADVIYELKRYLAQQGQLPFKPLSCLPTLHGHSTVSFLFQRVSDANAPQLRLVSEKSAEWSFLAPWIIALLLHDIYLLDSPSSYFGCSLCLHVFSNFLSSYCTRCTEASLLQGR